jgi:hypothetical protein
MDHRNNTIFAATLGVALCATMTSARAWDDAKYPDWKGQWERIGGGSFDTNKRPGRAQQPPLNAEYMAVWETNMKDEATGGQSYNTQVRCLPGGMPRMMIAYQPMEVIVTPEITYIAISFFGERRRVYTDGRDWPAAIKPSFSGYSIGRWLDEDGDGRYDVLEVETRGMKGPRTLDPSGIPVHKDNQTIVKERFFLDKANPDILRDEITTFDHAFTRPWIVVKGYTRERHPTWIEDVCAENNAYVFLGDETFLLSADGFLMPTKKGQAPPDLKYFNQAAK